MATRCEFNICVTWHTFNIPCGQTNRMVNGSRSYAQKLANVDSLLNDNQCEDMLKQLVYKDRFMKLNHKKDDL